MLIWLISARFSLAKYELMAHFLFSWIVKPSATSSRNMLHMAFCSQGISLDAGSKENINLLITYSHMFLYPFKKF